MSGGGAASGTGGAVDDDATFPSARREAIVAAYESRRPLDDREVRDAVEAAVRGLDGGALRVAEKRDGEWIAHPWLLQALSLYFRLRSSETSLAGPFEWHDKIPLKRDFAAARVRAVPGAIARYGAFLEPGVILMPSFVNVGARVGEATLIDTWATVGSSAQIGKRVHISGGVGIGGVLEPPQARPVIVEDDCFIGSRAIVVEGVLVETRAVLGAGVVLTASTPIVDVTGEDPVVTRGRVPADSVVIPGTQPKSFPAGTYGTPCALIIGRRRPSTDLKTSLNQALRDFEVPV